MNYYKRIQKAIDYIEHNLDCDIRLSEISAQADCSLYHFHRIFQAMTGDSVKDYIRKRRLSEAASELRNTRGRVIDIAFKYQYNTHESFSRAFTREFGVLPKDCRRSDCDIRTFDKVNVYENMYNSVLNGNLNGPEIINRGDFSVIGVEFCTNNNNEIDFKQIPRFWRKFDTLGLGKKIPNKIKPDSYLGYSYGFDEHANYKYLICSEVHDVEKVPKSMVCRTIPACKYATFVVKGPIPEMLINTWRYIFNTWLPASGYELSEKSDFEELDQSRTSLDIPEVTIYLPIK